MRRLLIMVPVAAALLTLPACSSAVAGTPVAEPPSARVPSAHVEFTQDPRDLAKNRTFDVVGDAGSTCRTADGEHGIDVGVSDGTAAEDTLSGISVQTGQATTPGRGRGPAVTTTNFNARVAGTDYDSSYRTDDGRVGTAAAEAVLGADGVLTVTFTATSWDGAAYHGTLRCRPTSS